MKTKWLLLITHASLFGAAGSSSNESYEKLHLLARKHVGLIGHITDSLKHYQQRSHIAHSLLIRGLAGNGKKSLAREIAKCADWPIREYCPRQARELEKIMTSEMEKKEPRMLFLKRIHGLVENEYLLED